MPSVSEAEGSGFHRRASDTFQKQTKRKRNPHGHSEEERSDDVGIRVPSVGKITAAKQENGCLWVARFSREEGRAFTKRFSFIYLPAPVTPARSGASSRSALPTPPGLAKQAEI